MLRGSSLLPSHRFGAARQRCRLADAREERHFIGTVAENRGSENRVSYNLCDRQRPNPAQRAGSGGGRNARATDERSRAFRFAPGDSPSRITSLPPAWPQSSFGKLRRSNVFGESTLPQPAADRNTKSIFACEQTVEDEACLWKAEENKVGCLLDGKCNLNLSIT
jgi:hypothetical protein